MRIESVRYFVHLLLSIAILEGVLGEIAKASVCSVCTCTDKTINCKARNFNKSISDTLWQGRNYSEFTEVIFDNNHIGHLTQLPYLPIKRLSYRNNQLVKIDSKAFINLTSLEELYLSGNELTSANLVPDVFQGQFDAQFYEPLRLLLLDLNGNEIHTLHPNLFQHTPFLERLYLRDNPFNIIDKSTVVAIASLRNLKVLDLSYTGIKKLPMGFLHTSVNLLELVLKGNSFDKIPDDNLAECYNLKVLNLNENPISVLSTQRPFPEMPSLKQLHISFMPNLTRIEEGALGGLINLEYLDCSMNKQLVYISPMAFKNDHSQWPDIVKLDLSDNSLSYLDVEFLKPVWNSIKEIKIVGNPLVCDCENQWIVSELVPLLLKTSSPVEALQFSGLKESGNSRVQIKRIIKGKALFKLASDIMNDPTGCAEPSAMKGQRLVTLYSKNYTMRCLDIYGSHPENDGPILISMFVMIIVTLIIILGLVIWMRNSSCRQGGRVNYHRAFYRPTRLEDSDKY